MKYSQALLSITLLCSSTLIVANGFGQSQITSGIKVPFMLTVENKTADPATVKAVYSSTETVVGTVEKGATKLLPITSNDLKKVIITAGSTTETVTNVIGSQKITIIKKLNTKLSNIKKPNSVGFDDKAL